MDSKKLSPEKHREFEKHLKQCSTCRNKMDEADRYQSAIEKIKRQVPVLDNSDSMINQIIESVESISNETTKIKTLSPYNLMRIAALIILMFTAGFYLQQKTYINNSVAALNKTYFTPKANEAFIESYNSCIQESKGMLTEIFEEDEVFLIQLLENAKSITPINFNKYAARVCQSDFLYSSDDVDTKKKLLINFIEQEILEKK